MDCRAFIDCLADIAAGSCPTASRNEALNHAAGCNSCAGLLRAWQAEEEPGGDFEQDEFTRSILARTSGAAACDAARDRLPDYVDATAGAIDTELVAGHLARCASCRTIAETLFELSAELPSLAEIDPGPGFAAAVTHATTGAAARRESIGARLDAWWGRLLERPRIGFELAYAGTLLLVLAFGNPAATLQAASSKTYALAETGLSQARAALPSIVPSIENRAASQRSRIEKIRAFSDAVSQRRLGFEQRLLAAWQQAWTGFVSTVSEVQRLAGTVRDSVAGWWANVTMSRGANEPAGQSGRYTRQERASGAEQTARRDTSAK
ncbi:MAG: zf-HC2 domain-containing protein [Vicinamibacterales bacterium]